MRDLTLYHDDGSETQVPFRWRICGHCRGTSKSSAYLGAYTWEEMDEAGEEFIEDYFAGNYDRPCDCCDGTGKVQEVDRKAMSTDDRAAWDAQCQGEAEDRACEAAERRMGA